MIKVTHIRNVEQIKDGVGRDGKVWVLYRVVDADGDRYSTFNARPYFRAMEQDVEITIQFTEEEVTKEGRTFKNRKLIEGRAANQKPAKPKAEPLPPLTPKAESQLDRIEKKIDHIIEII